MREIIEPEIVFSNNHIFIIYLIIKFIKVKKEDISLDKNYFDKMKLLI